jgi:hypothetical protein
MEIPAEPPPPPLALLIVPVGSEGCGGGAGIGGGVTPGVTVHEVGGGPEVRPGSGADTTSDAVCCQGGAGDKLGKGAAIAMAVVGKLGM